jgi:ribonuclease HI
MAKKKFYAVKVGRASGIYQTWDECKRQVDGFSGALYKSFLTIEEARQYLDESRGKAVDQPVCRMEKGKHYDIYVDGSYYNKQYSWGFAAYRGEELVHTASGAGEDHEAAAIHNVAGELAATVKAIEWAKTQEPDSITIHHDYIGISEWATGRWKANNQFTQGYAAFAATCLDWVNFHKVAGHSGIPGNELADKLAGEALRR